jgi:hypothetical protein
MAESATFYNKGRATECCNIIHIASIRSATLDTTLTLTRHIAVVILHVKETTQFANVVFVCDSCSSDWFILYKHISVTSDTVSCNCVAECPVATTRQLYGIEPLYLMREVN